MTEAEIKRVILFVANEAWEIAAKGNASAEVCLAIEALSDDPQTCEELIKKIKADFNYGAVNHGNRSCSRLASY